MVFFICEGCNETLKKNKVDAHANRCKSCWAVACVDCSKVFEGDSYRTHLTCISEAEKYQGALYQSSKQKNKKLKPQERWMQVVQNTTTTDTTANAALKRIAAFDNVPRIKKKFINFVNNSVRLHNPILEEKIWNILQESFLQSSKDSDTITPTSSSIDDKLTSTVKINTKKRDLELDEENNSRNKSLKICSSDDLENQCKENKEFPSLKRWSKLIRHILKETPDNCLPLKSLRKQVINSYITSQEKNNCTKKELKKEFKRNILMISKIKIQDNKVIYVK